MTQIAYGLRRTLFCLACCGAALVSFALRAEVALVENHDDVYTVIAVGSIVDDSDPVGQVWHNLGGNMPGKAILNTDGAANEDGNPTFVINPGTNLPIVAWSRNSAQGYDVVVSHFAEGAWSDPLPLASSPADELDPFLLLDPQDDTVHLFYWIHDASPRVMHRQAPADLSSWSLPEQVSQAGEISSRPAAVFHAGDLKVVYEVHEFGYPSTPRQIVIATYDGLGFSPSTVALTTFGGANRPEVHARKGKLWVEWVGSDGVMNWTRESAQGGWEPVQVEGFAGIEDRDYHVRGRVKALVLD